MAGLWAFLAAILFGLTGYRANIAPTCGRSYGKDKSFHLLFAQGRGFAR